MQTQTTKPDLTQSIASTHTSRLLWPDVAALVLAILLLGVTLFLPWLDIAANGEAAALSRTGQSLIFDAPSADFAEIQLTALTAGDDSRNALDAAADTLAWVINDVELVLIAGALALLGALIALMFPPLREFAALLPPAAALIALVYFVPVFALNQHTVYDFNGYVGVGFWVAFGLILALIAQGFLPRPAPAGGAVWASAIRHFVWQNRIYLLILLLLLVLPHAVGWFTDSSPFAFQRGRVYRMSGPSGTWMSIFIEIFALTILVMSYNLMFGFTGVISFGHALFFGMGGYILGMLLQQTDLSSNLAVMAALLGTLLICGGLGFAMGLASLRLRGIYFAIFTLAVAEMVFIFVGRWSQTGGEEGFVVDSMPLWLDSDANRLNLYYMGLLAFVFVFLFIQRLVNSPTGAVFQAIRENEERAKSIGYNTLYYKLLSITVAGMMAGIAGMLHGALNKKLGPEMFGVNHTVNALLMTIIGGVGTLTGPVIGATILHLIEAEFQDRTLEILGTTVNIQENWLLILGLIFVVVVMVFPYGIVGTYYTVKARLIKRLRG